VWRRSEEDAQLRLLVDDHIIAASGLLRPLAPHLTDRLQPVVVPADRIDGHRQTRHGRPLVDPDDAPVAPVEEHADLLAEFLRRELGLDRDAHGTRGRVGGGAAQQDQA